MNYQQSVREEMVYYGAEQLSFKQLLSVALGSSNVELITWLSNFGIRKLSEMGKDELKEIEGIGETLALRIQAIFTIAKQLQFSKKPDYDVICCPDDGARILDYLKYESQEHFVCLYLNTKNQVISKRHIFKGSLDSSIVHPREIFKEAIRISASKFICAHNHPSGDPTPSREDINITKRLFEAGETIGIHCLDHLIIGEHCFISLKEKGHLY